MGLERWNLTDDMFQRAIPDGDNLISKRQKSKKACGMFGEEQQYSLTEMQDA